MNVVLVGYDVAPSKSFELLTNEFLRRGHLVSFRYFGHGKGPQDGVKEQIDKVFKFYHIDFVLAGMSSTAERADLEVYAAKAAGGNGIKYGLYADTYGCHKREWFKDVRSRVRLLFVVDEKQKENAESLFPKHAVVVSKNPLWEDYMTPAVDRGVIRQKIGVSDNQQVVLVPGTKTMVINATLFGSVAAAMHCADMKWRDRVLVLSTHPGDKNDMKDFFDGLKKFSSFDVKVVTKDIASSSELVPASDIVVQVAGSVGVETAYQRKPVINFYNEVIGNWMKAEAVENCEGEAMLTVYHDTMRLSKVMNDLLSPETLLRENMMLAQEETFSIPPVKGTAVRLMADEIEKAVLK